MNKPELFTFGEDQKASEFIPERKLLIAIIQRAVVDYLCQEAGKRHLQYDAACWLFSSSSTPFSFYWCCEALCECPDSMVRRIRLTVRSAKPHKPNSVIVRVDR